MTQTDAEIVARALRVYYGIPADERAPEADGIAAAVVAALTEEGRLVSQNVTCPACGHVMEAGLAADSGD